jgi:hypothetical protein
MVKSPLSHSNSKLQLNPNPVNPVNPVKNSIHKSAQIRTNQLVKICDDLWTYRPLAISRISLSSPKMLI